jgi:hypothetical protein
LIVLGLGVVLVLVAAIAVTGARAGERAAAKVRTSGSLTYAYLLAQDALSREDAVEDVFEDQPSAVLGKGLPSRMLRDDLAVPPSEVGDAGTRPRRSVT